MMALNVTELNEEVFFNRDPIATVQRNDIEWLKAKALRNKRKRIRLCTHRSTEDAIHEMLIVHTRGAYLQPHKHPNKTVSYHMIEGNLDLVIFDDRGTIARVIKMGGYSSGNAFYWRLAESEYYSVIPRSETVVFNEVVNGPWERETSYVAAPWSPDEGDGPAAEVSLTRLQDLIRTAQTGA